MSGRMYMGSLGYSLYTFVSDSPFDPFYPDIEKFRLCGTTTREVSWLGHAFHCGDDLLVAL